MSNPHRHFKYLTCCIHSDAKSIQDMTGAARDITLRTFRKHCDSFDWETAQGYERRGGLPLSRDWHVSFHKSVYQGTACYYVRHSAIEYIFTAV